MATESKLFGGKGPETEASDTQSEISQDLYKTAKPLTSELFGQMLEGLRTGGIQARIPIIQSAVDSQKRATSDALRSLDESLGQSGLAGTPYGARVRSEASIEGASKEAAIPTNSVLDFLKGAIGLATGTNTTAETGLSSVTASEAQVTSAQLAAIASIIGSTAGTASKGCWIAASLYGYGSVEFYAARYYIHDVWRGPIASMCRWLYRHLGKSVARQHCLVKALRPLFNVAVQRGLEAR